MQFVVDLQKVKKNDRNINIENKIDNNKKKRTKLIIDKKKIDEKISVFVKKKNLSPLFNYCPSTCSFALINLIMQ